MVTVTVRFKGRLVDVEDVDQAGHASNGESEGVFIVYDTGYERFIPGARISSVGDELDDILSNMELVA